MMLDEYNTRKLEEIIDRQFDIELNLKHREIAAIRNEIDKAYQALSDLEQEVRNEMYASLLPTLPHYTRRTANAIYQGRSATAMAAPAKSKPPKSSSSVLYGRRSDGVYVRLACPVCHRENFSNQLGFLNHCRISHSLEFGPYENVMVQCGTPVKESDVPEDHPARLRPVLSIQPEKAKERPIIKEYEEDVSLELDQEKNENDATRSEQVMARATPHSPLSSTNIDNVPPAHQQDKTSLQTNPVVTDPLTCPTQSLPSAATLVSNDSLAGSGSDNAPQSLVSAIEDKGSRFYIQRRIIVGNVSKFIPPEKRDATLKNYTHKWMIYVVEPNQDREKPTFITGIRYHLHPSYKPHDVVDVTEPPYRLTRLGWGEFPIRLQLHFVDKRRNRSLDVIHQLRLDHTHSGRQVFGAERAIDIELDRNTDFDDVSNFSPQSHLAVTTNPMDQSSIATNQRVILLQGIIKEQVLQLPLVASSRSYQQMPYSCAESIKEFYSWPLAKQKAVEWHRARLLRLQVQHRCNEINEPLLRAASKSLTTKDTLLWCRDNHHIPKDSGDKQATKLLDFCRFCGQLDHAIADCQWKPKSWSKRGRDLYNLSSMSATDELLQIVRVNDDRYNESTEIDVDMQRCDSSSSTRFQELARFITADMHNKIAREPAMLVQLDWIWKVISDLRLRSMVGNDIAQSKHGQLHLQRSADRQLDLSAAMQQRLIVGDIVLLATKMFLRRLLLSGLAICKVHGQSADDRGKKMLVPYHIHQAATMMKDFDFLTCKFMGTISNGD
ncbi:yeats family-domain-containing protein [Gongronella butleri]|nr:yeats family-domain-containing protein [Gongronella butleri]